jgi:multiple sugar transport system ATP-binding protein
MRTEITKLHNRLATTFVYVTHDQVEAMTMGTRIVVMKDGFMQQVDTPINLYDYPINQFVAGFIGTPQMNFYTAKLTGTKTKVYVEFGDDKVLLPQSKVKLIVGLEKYLNTEKEITFGIRPEDIHDDAEWLEKAKTASIKVKVDVVEALGAEKLLYCKTGHAITEEEVSIADDISNLIAKVDGRSTTTAGGEIALAFDMEHCHLFDKFTEVTIMARSADDKAYLEELIAKREEEETVKAEERAKKEEEERIKKEVEIAKKEAKLAKKAKKAAPVEVVEETVETTEETKVVETEEVKTEETVETTEENK